MWVNENMWVWACKARIRDGLHCLRRSTVAGLGEKWLGGPSNMFAGLARLHCSTVCV
jgi:hypothetical protein